MASPPMVALRWANKPQPGPFLDRPKYILDGDLPPNGNRRHTRHAPRTLLRLVSFLKKRPERIPSLSRHVTV